jgi:type I restriction enzyme, S subunit
MNATIETKVVSLQSILLDAKSGFAVGERESDGFIQLRMNNVSVSGDLDLSKPTRVPVSSKQQTEYSLKKGDVLFNNTNSPSLVGKSAYFPGYDEPVLYSNHFTRLRFDATIADPKYVAYWLTQKQQSGFFESRCKQWVNQASFGRDDLLSLEIPLPSLAEQKWIAAILDKADAIRRKRQDSKVLWEHMLRSAYISSFGDPVANPKGWPVSEIGKIADMVTGYAFKSTEYVNEGVRLCRGANVMPDLLDWSDVRYWRPDDASIDSRLHLIKDDVVLAMDRPWISTGIKVAQVTEDDLPAYLVQRVSRLRGKGRISNAFLFYTLRHPAFTAHCGGLKTATTVPHISPQDIRSFPVPVAPESVHEEFERLAQQAKQVTKKLELAANEANNLFNSLVQRAFKGEL